MTEGAADEAGWFDGLDPADVSAAADAIRSGGAETPRKWPTEAVDRGFAADESAYYEALRAGAIEAARAAVTERETAADRQLVHAIRSMDDLAETTNELSEHLAEWASSSMEQTGSGLEYAREIAERTPADATEERVIALAERVLDLAAERRALREYVTAETPSIAPNLAAIAGPVLAARLVALAGDLESLAKMPSGTVQVLGAEDALFAHLQGHAPSPKHGVIFTHEYVRETAPEHRGSAARALAGKLAIAARVDHYSGTRKPEIDAALDERIQTIRSRGSD